MSTAKERYYCYNKENRWEKQNINSYITDYVTELEQQVEELNKENKALKDLIRYSRE